MDGSLTPHKDGTARRVRSDKGRLTPKLRHAIKLRVEEGLTIAAACARAGVSEAGWHKAMNRPAGQIAYEMTELAFIQTIERRRKGYKARAIEVAAELMERAQSEAVRMKAVEFFAGETRQPLVAVQVNAPQAEGYAYRRPDTVSAADRAQAIDGTAEPGKPE